MKSTWIQAEKLVAVVLVMFQSLELFNQKCSLNKSPTVIPFSLHVDNGPKTHVMSSNDGHLSRLEVAFLIGAFWFTHSLATSNSLTSGFRFPSVQHYPHVALLYHSTFIQRMGNDEGKNLPITTSAWEKNIVGWLTPRCLDIYDSLYTVPDFK